jgi:hypothetical protein
MGRLALELNGFRKETTGKGTVCQWANGAPISIYVATLPVTKGSRKENTIEFDI